MRSDIAPGGTFPDYELPDHENVPRKLSEIQGDDPLILTLARGNYCPKEHQQHLELRRVRADGRVYLTPEPKDMLVFVAGGLGGLHATGFHTFGTSLAQTRPIAEAVPAHAA